jgi:hypothetical protein
VHLSNWVWVGGELVSICCFIGGEWLEVGASAQYFRSRWGCKKRWSWYAGRSGRWLEFELLAFAFLTLNPMLEPELMHPVIVLAACDQPFC